MNIFLNRIALLGCGIVAASTGYSAADAPHGSGEILTVSMGFTAANSDRARNSLLEKEGEIDSGAWKHLSGALEYSVADTARFYDDGLTIDLDHADEWAHSTYPSTYAAADTARFYDDGLTIDAYKSEILKVYQETPPADFNIADTARFYDDGLTLASAIATSGGTPTYRKTLWSQ
jgi:hypothetical protein